MFWQHYKVCFRYKIVLLECSEMILSLEKNERTHQMKHLELLSEPKICTDKKAYSSSCMSPPWYEVVILPWQCLGVWVAQCCCVRICCHREDNKDWMTGHRANKREPAILCVVRSKNSYRGYMNCLKHRVEVLDKPRTLGTCKWDLTLT